MDLAAGADGGEAVDQALRAGARLSQLWDVFGRQPRRPDNRARAAVLRDSRDSPWSEGERLLHRLLRAAGIRGWLTNVPLRIGGHTYRPDVLFRREQLILEFDGFEFHSSRAAHDGDRFRRNELELAGYRVLNFTWRQLVDDPDWVIGCIRRALDGRRQH